MYLVSLQLSVAILLLRRRRSAFEFGWISRKQAIDLWYMRILDHQWLWLSRDTVSMVLGNQPRYFTQKGMLVANISNWIKQHHCHWPKGWIHKSSSEYVWAQSLAMLITIPQRTVNQLQQECRDYTKEAIIPTHFTIAVSMNDYMHPPSSRLDS